MTASYRKESDFTSIYYSDSGIRWTDRPKTTTKNVFESKRGTGLAAALISHGVPPRAAYVKNLQKYIEITVFGAMGTPCPDNVDSDRFDIGM